MFFVSFAVMAFQGLRFPDRIVFEPSGTHPDLFGKQSLFAMVDIIDDDPDRRWLSVCFFGEMISDPDELGDFVPEGLGLTIGQ